MDKFEYLYHKYKNLVHWIAMQKLHDSQKAEDCVQDTFVWLFANLNKIDDADSPSTKNYIATVAQGKAISMYRKEKFRLVSFAQDLGSSDISEYETQFDDYDSVELGCAIDKLDDEKKNIVILKYFYGLKSKEIGKLYGISDALVRKRLQLALKELHEILK